MRSMHRLHSTCCFFCQRHAIAMVPSSAKRLRKHASWRSFDMRLISFFISTLHMVDHKNRDERGMKLGTLCNAVNGLLLSAVASDRGGCDWGGLDLQGIDTWVSERYTLSYIVAYSEGVHALLLSRCYVPDDFSFYHFFLTWVTMTHLSLSHTSHYDSLQWVTMTLIYDSFRLTLTHYESCTIFIFVDCWLS